MTEEEKQLDEKYHCFSSSFGDFLFMLGIGFIATIIIIGVPAVVITILMAIANAYIR